MSLFAIRPLVSCTTRTRQTPCARRRSRNAMTVISGWWLLVWTFARLWRSEYHDCKGSSLFLSKQREHSPSKKIRWNFWVVFVYSVPLKKNQWRHTTTDLTLARPCFDVFINVIWGGEAKFRDALVLPFYTNYFPRTLPRKLGSVSWMGGRTTMWKVKTIKLAIKCSGPTWSNGICESFLQKKKNFSGNIG